MLVDTHAHIDFFENPKLVVDEARNHGVDIMVIPGVEPASFSKINDIVQEFDGVYGAYGVHPSEANKFDKNTPDEIIKYLKEDKTKAIGEIGLDYYYKENLDKELQGKVFKIQLEIAKAFNLPVLIHAREASLDTYNIMCDMGVKHAVMHCFSGSLEFAKDCIKKGWMIGIGGVVTFKNAKKLKEVVQNIPIEHIVLETDCPYLAPHPFRGEENAPKYIPLIAKEIANLKDMEYDRVCEITTLNAKRFFSI